MSRARSVGLTLRFRVLERDGHRCQYCGARAPNARLEIDHVVPVADGGKDDPSNLVTACFDCNRGKRAQVGHSYQRRWEIDNVLLDKDPDGFFENGPRIRAVSSMLWELDMLAEGIELARQSLGVADWLAVSLKEASEELRCDADRFKAEAAE